MTRVTCVFATSAGIVIFLDSKFIADIGKGAFPFIEMSSFGRMPQNANKANAGCHTVGVFSKMCLTWVGVKMYGNSLSAILFGSCVAPKGLKGIHFFAAQKPKNALKVLRE